MCVVHVSTMVVMKLHNSMQVLTKLGMEIDWRKFHYVCPKRVEGALKTLKRIGQMTRKLRCLMTGRLRMQVDLTM